jgi:phosphoglucomutase
VVRVRDFRKDVIHDEEGDLISKEKMLFIDLADGRSFAVRPSGTEPKIKYYMFGRNLPAAGKKFSAKELRDAKTKVIGSLQYMWGWIDRDVEKRLK